MISFNFHVDHTIFEAKLTARKWLVSLLIFFLKGNIDGGTKVFGPIILETEMNVSGLGVPNAMYSSHICLDSSVKLKY